MPTVVDREKVLYFLVKRGTILEYIAADSFESVNLLLERTRSRYTVSEVVEDVVSRNACFWGVFEKRPELTAGGTYYLGCSSVRSSFS